MTDLSVLPSDQDLIAYIRQWQPCRIGFLVEAFKADRDALREQLKRLKKDGLLKSESMKQRESVMRPWRYFSEWSVA